MKHITAIILCGMIMCMLCIAGCTSSTDHSVYEPTTITTTLPTQTTIQTPAPTTEPEDVFRTYFSGYIHLNEDIIWDVLSTKAQSENSKNKIYNTLYALSSDGTTTTSSYKITKTHIGDDSATLYISVNGLVGGYKFSKDKEIPFVRENGDWKIDEFIILV